jgi:hypothetical protein
MKKIVLPLFCCVASLFLVSCFKEEDDGKPDDVIASSVRAETLVNIDTKFKQDVSAKDNMPALFDPKADKGIVLSQEAEVFVTFVSENASYQNSLGYYTYNINQRPTNVSQVELHVLFPNVSDNVITQGDMVQVGTGKFPAGTAIGFFIIINGWEKGSLHEDRDKIYTDMAFNPGGEQQHILFKFKGFGDIVLGFEDILIATAGNHVNDFNDLLFTVTDNKDKRDPTSFNLTNVIVIEP